MSNLADFSSYQITTSDFKNSSCTSYDYYDKENCNINISKPTQRLPLQPKNTSTSALSERTDVCSNRSTQDSPIDYERESRNINVNSPSNILEQPTTSECQHTNVVTYRCKYCKDCAMFLPKTGSTVYRESTYSEKLNSCPDEVYSIMLESQHKNREYVPDAPHIQYRKTITDWIFQVSQDLKLSPDTTSAIISYVDTVLCKVDVSKDNLQLVILTCLVLATKFSEMDEKVPSLREAYNLCQGAYTIDLFKKSENFVLKQLDWSLKTITPYQFCHTYLSKGCLYSTDKCVFGQVDEDILRYLRRYSECFINLSLDNYDFNQYTAHIIACAAIASTRKLIGIYPLWNAELEELTATSWDAIEPCFNQLYSKFELSFPELTNLAETLAEKRGIKPINKQDNKTINKKALKKEFEVLDTENDQFLMNECTEGEESTSKGSVCNKKISKLDNNGRKKEFATKKKLTSKSSKESKPRSTKSDIMSIEASKEFFDNGERNSSFKRNLIC